MTYDRVGVHVTHCCFIHGCKYGKDDCPVELGTHDQEYPCEYCAWDDEVIKEEPMMTLSEALEITIAMFNDATDPDNVVLTDKEKQAIVNKVRRAMEGISDRIGY